MGKILADLLAHHEVARGEPTAAALRRADVLVTGAGWLPDEPWLAIDALCTETGTPWHRYHLDGRYLVVGPIFLPGHTASYRDTRGRLLAAVHDADGLAAHWHALGDAERRPPASWLTRGAGAVAAGLVAADIDAVLSRGPVPSAGFQLVYDPVTAALTRHPVLPLPPVWRARSAGHGR